MRKTQPLTSAPTVNKKATMQGGTIKRSHGEHNPFIPKTALVNHNVLQLGSSL
jgi:hypothetical protein